MPVTSRKFKAAKRLFENSVAEFTRAHEEGLRTLQHAKADERMRGLSEAIARERAAIKKLRQGIKLQGEAIRESSSRKH